MPVSHKILWAAAATLLTLALPFAILLLPGGGFFLGFVWPLMALAVFTAALIRRLWRWLGAPAPWNISLIVGESQGVPGLAGDTLGSPATKGQALLRLTVEAVTFRALWRNVRPGPAGGPAFRRDLRLALASLLMHLALLGIALGHIRFFWPNPPAWFFYFDPPPWIFGLAFMAALSVLAGFRLKPPTSLFTDATDLWPLFMMASIAVTGLLLWGTTSDQAALAAPMHNLMRLRYAEAELPALFYAHFFQAMLFIAWLPTGKLLHGLGIWLMPTLNQANNARAARHINPFNPEVEPRAYLDYQADNLESLKAAGLPIEDGNQADETNRENK